MARLLILTHPVCVEHIAMCRCVAGLIKLRNSRRRRRLASASGNHSTQRNISGEQNRDKSDSNLISRSVYVYVQNKTQRATHCMVCHKAEHRLYQIIIQCHGTISCKPVTPVRASLRQCIGNSQNRNTKTCRPGVLNFTQIGQWRNELRVAIHKRPEIK
jgi:hypothetical protein